MSSCRCSDIEQCMKNIQKLELAAEEIDHLAGPYLEISDNLNLLSNKVNGAYEASNINLFAEELKGLKDDMRDAMDYCQDVIGEGINKLQTQLDSWMEEDEEYHAELDEEEDFITTETTNG